MGIQNNIKAGENLDQDKQLDDLCKSMLSNVDGGLTLEQEIKEKARVAAKSLCLGVKTVLEMDDRKFLLRSNAKNMSGNTIRILAADIDKYRILTKYKPYTATGEISNNLSLEENLAATIEALMRHVLDLIQPEEEPDTI